jgi:hypothetical protein
MTSDVLLMDFNCLIYRCLRSPSLPPYDENEDWEKHLLKEVASWYVGNSAMKFIQYCEDMLNISIQDTLLPFPASYTPHYNGSSIIYSGTL